MILMLFQCCFSIMTATAIIQYLSCIFHSYLSLEYEGAEVAPETILIVPCCKHN